MALTTLRESQHSKHRNSSDCVHQNETNQISEKNITSQKNTHTRDFAPKNVGGGWEDALGWFSGNTSLEVTGLGFLTTVGIV